MNETFNLSVKMLVWLLSMSKKSTPAKLTRHLHVTRWSSTKYSNYSYFKHLGGFPWQENISCINQRVILRGKMWMVVLSVGVIKSRTPIKWIPSSFSLSLSLFVINCSNVTFRNLLRINSLHFLFPSKK